MNKIILLITCLFSIGLKAQNIVPDPLTVSRIMEQAKILNMDLSTTNNILEQAGHLKLDSLAVSRLMNQAANLKPDSLSISRMLEQAVNLKPDSLMFSKLMQEARNISLDSLSLSRMLQQGVNLNLDSLIRSKLMQQVGNLSLDSNTIAKIIQQEINFKLDSATYNKAILAAAKLKNGSLSKEEIISGAASILPDSVSYKSKAVDFQVGFLPSTNKSINNFADLKIRYSPHLSTNIRYSTKSFQYEETNPDDYYETYETKVKNNKDDLIIQADLLTYIFNPKSTTSEDDFSIHAALSLSALYINSTSQFNSTTPWERDNFRSVNVSEGTLKSEKLIPAMKANLNLKYKNNLDFNLSAGLVYNNNRNNLIENSFFSSRFFIDEYSGTPIESPSGSNIVVSDVSNNIGFNVDAILNIHHFAGGTLVMDFSLLQLREKYEEVYTEVFTFYDPGSNYIDYYQDTFEEDLINNEIRVGLQYELDYFKTKWGIVPGFRVDYFLSEYNESYDFGLVLKY